MTLSIVGLQLVLMVISLRTDQYNELQYFNRVFFTLIKVKLLHNAKAHQSIGLIGGKDLTY